MLRPHPPLFRNDHHEALLTVQVSAANSHLGHLLLEADWEETLDYLATPEGQRDVDAKNDPLGLFASKNKHARVPISKNTAAFASLFVRAPFEVIKKIFTMTPSNVDLPEDLMYVLAVVPSEEEARCQKLHQKVPYRTRAWTAKEYVQILYLLLQSFVNSKAPSSSLLDVSLPWIINTSSLTPLAIASYNHDVPDAIVQLLCALEPQAMDKECKFFGAFQNQPTPLIMAAASPLPPESSPKYNDAKNLRWQKVKLLILPKTWYDEKRERLLEAVDLTVSLPPEPTTQQIQHACEDAIQRNEWELVREFVKHYYLRKDKQVETKKEDESSMLEPIQRALSQHDEKYGAALQRRQQIQEKAQAREEWLHKNMGLVMYPIDAALDLISVVIPSSKKKDRDAISGIVLPMS